MTGSRTIIIGGGGIGGLTAALALAQRGFRAVVLDQAERPESIGAGIQLTPNATRLLEALGLGEKLRATAVVPRCVRVLHAKSAEEIVRIPFDDAQERYGAPYWVMHRGDLYATLLEAAREHPDVSLEFGARVETFASHTNGVTVKAMRGPAAVDAQGIAFIAADGIWSVARGALDEAEPPKFVHRVAWRATVAAETVLPWMREPEITLWLGHKTHLVHYPVRAGQEVNIVAIAADRWSEPGWSAPSEPDEVMEMFDPKRWSRHARDLIGMPEQWLKWALAERPVAKQWGRDQITLLGDAAHPMLPFMAQGAAMAIEDAAVLARHMVGSPDDPASAMRRYEADRRSRTVQVQRAARKNGKIYQYRGPDAAVRNFVMRRLGGARIRKRYDWIYGWRDDAAAVRQQEHA
ncbi:MAG: FAD-dependent monooxygenase [Xanthobacteraceae bacterium]